jgi:predicted dehydrogenase
VDVPDSVDLADASTVALGAIALQGVRRFAPTLGETVVVLGLGALGQLVCQILRANGVRVIASDPSPVRVQLACSLGADMVIDPSGDADGRQVLRLTGGIGADGVIITAATPSDEVMSMAFRMCRRKGRVVLVGDVGLHLRRQDIYEKELDFFVSTSYGPGRYDAHYEAEGLDYPVGYVRWTENRNMQEYLRLLAEQKVRVQPLVSGIFPVDRVNDAYNALQAGEPTARPLLALLRYAESTSDCAATVRVTRNPTVAPNRSGLIRLAIIGAGSFAAGVHLPNLRTLSNVFGIHAIVSRTGHKALALAQQFGARHAATDVEQVLSDDEVDAVLIATRHDSHADLALRALRAGKHVFVEKPLALTLTELTSLEDYFAKEDSTPLLMTGFNRRFSPHAKRIRELLANRSDAMVLNYRMNAGFVPRDSWLHGPEGGGRNIGEACHIYDLMISLTDSRIDGVSAVGLRPKGGYHLSDDNFVVTLSFADGSVGTLTYTSLGAGDFPKEHLEIYVDGRVIRLVDYKTTEVFGAKANGLSTRLVEKGHLEELEAFARAVRDGGEWPIAWWQQAEATGVSFQIVEAMRSASNDGQGHQQACPGNPGANYGSV